MSRRFKINKRQYDNFDLYQKSMITLNPGVTVLVGCNGSGKTTLLNILKNKLKKLNIPVLHFNNLKDGGHGAVSSAGFFRDYSLMSQLICSSEGESIVLNMCNLAQGLRHFIKTGQLNDRQSQLDRAFKRLLSNTDNNTNNEPIKERWLLFDAVDSGLSVDNIIDLKEKLFNTILEDRDDCDVYIIISANEYELARSENCFDVYSGKYIKFKDYEDYRNFITDSRTIKDKRQYDR